MSINRPTFTSISILERELKKLIEKKKIQSALDLIKEFVESIINNSLSVAKVFASRELDELCGDIGKVVAKGFVESINCPAIKTGTVILVSEFVATGGHIEIIKDIIRLRLSPSPVTLIVTNLFDRVDYTAFKAFDENFDVKVEVVPNSPSDKRLDWLFKRLYGLSPPILNTDSVPSYSTALAKASATSPT